MSKKVRIAISCVLVAVAFVFGIVTFSKLNGNDTKQAIAEDPAVYFTDAQGRVAEVPGGTTLEARMSRGSSEENPFFVLEILPYEGEAEFGYHIAGCEPVDVQEIQWRNGSIPGESTFYDVVTYNRIYAYWKGEQPSNFPTATLEKMKQFGYMKKVEDGSGNYNRSDEVKENIEIEPGVWKTDVVTSATYTKVTSGGEYLWQPLSAEECLTIAANAELTKEYTDAYHMPDDEGKYKMYFDNVEYYKASGKELKHKNTFLRESVGLAYEINDEGVRVSLPEDEVKEAIKNYHALVYPITPEDLNGNQHLIERADMIVISSGSKMGAGAVKLAYNNYKRADLFTHLDGATLSTSESSTFITNPLDWNAVLKIYDRATDPQRRCPIIFDGRVYQGLQNKTSDITMDLKFANGSTLNKTGQSGSDNNIYKLFLMLYQMPVDSFEALFGDPTSSTNTLFTAENTTVQMKHTDSEGNIQYVKTGIFNQYTTDAKKYWNKFTFFPWKFMPNSTVGSSSEKYSSYLNMFSIQGDDGTRQIYAYDSDGAQNGLQDGTYLFMTNNLMDSNFHTDAANPADSFKATDNDQYGYAVYDFFDSINGSDKGEPSLVTTAQVLYYLLNGLNSSNPATPAENNHNYKVLEIQPWPIYIDNSTDGSSTYWDTFIRLYTGTTGHAKVDRISTSELIGKNVDILSEYDLIYFGLNRDDNDFTMDYSGTDYIYAHTGPRITLNTAKTSMFGWLYTGGAIDATIKNDSAKIALESQFVYSGNDITKRVRDMVLAYGAKGYPVVFADGFYGSNNNPSSSSQVVNTVDRNSYVYDVASKINDNNYVYVGSLATTGENAAQIIAEESAKLRTALAKSTQVEWIMTETPPLYNVAASVVNCVAQSDDYLPSNRSLAFTFSLKAPVGATYKLNISVDLNGDGKFALDEELSANNFSLYNVTTGSYIYNGNVIGGNTYRVVKSSIDDRIGSVYWKLDLINNSDGVVYQSLSGVSAIAAKNESEKVEIKVLQIESTKRQTIYLPMNSEVGADNKVHLSDTSNKDSSMSGSGLNDVSTLFYEDIKRLKDFNIEFVRIKESDISSKDESEIFTYFNGFDMIVLGFADAYTGVSNQKVINAIEAFRAKGKAILYTHDNSSMVGADGTNPDTNLSDNTSWGTALTKKFRDAFGMDRYDVLGLKAKKTDLDSRADIPYEPSSSDNSKPIMAKDSHGNASDYMLAQGMTDGILFRHSGEFPSSVHNPYTNKISCVNQGGLTQYPYTIDDEITTALTHTQYYQLDMETDKIVVWYTLGGQDGSGGVDQNNTANAKINTYYKANVKDVRNNYYIYNIDNVTYSGMGHSGNLDREEVRLFINTFIAAYRATNKPVAVKVENIDASGDSGTGYFLTVDVDSNNPEAILMVNDARNSYYLQKGTETVGEYVKKEPAELVQSKRVYFRVVDTNQFSIKQYSFRFTVDGVAMDLAVFRKMDNQFMNHSFDNPDGISDVTDSGDTESAVFYVDVPIVAKEGTVADKKAVENVVLNIKVDARHKLSADLDWLETIDEVGTNVTITPRGLFDLD